MRVTPLRLLLSALPLLALAGCGTPRSCGGNQEYLQAQERPRLQMPPDVLASERMQPVVIPPAAPDPQKLDPPPRCLDFPPPYFARKPGSAPAPAAPAPAAAPEVKPDAP